jgi:hypothetical protein
MLFNDSYPPGISEIERRGNKDCSNTLKTISFPSFVRACLYRLQNLVQSAEADPDVLFGRIFWAQLGLQNILIMITKEQGDEIEGFRKRSKRQWI